MKSTPNLFFVIAICSLAVPGCDSNDKLASSTPKAETSVAASESREKPTPAAPETPSAKDATSNKAICTVKYKGESYELLQAACYVVEESDGPVKCVLFSDSPIDVALLKKELQEEGVSLCRWYYSKDSKVMLCFREREYGVTVEVSVGTLSMSIGPEKIESTLSYSQGNIAGKIVTTAPIDDGRGNPFEFAAQLNQPVVYSEPKQDSPEATN